MATINEEQMRHELKRSTLNFKMKKGVNNMSTKTNAKDLRTLLLEDEPTRDFYLSLEHSLRANHILGGQIEVPEQAMTRIKEIVKETSALYDEVLKVPVGTDGRIVIDTGEFMFTWGALSEVDVQPQRLEVEDLTLGGYIKVCKSALEDTTINTYEYIEAMLAETLARALDHGMINGAGDYETVLEPVGVLKNLAPTNEVTSDFTIKDLLSKVSLITQGDKKDIGEVIAVMKRSTYYTEVLPQVTTNQETPNINGVRVKFTGAVGDNTILLGDFSQYLLTERAEGKITRSDDKYFTDDQSVFKLVSRYDGKPLNMNAFVKVTKA